MINLDLDQDVANTRERKQTAAHKVAKSYPLQQAAEMPRYNSLIVINPSEENEISQPEIICWCGKMYCCRTLYFRSFISFQGVIFEAEFGASYSQMMPYLITGQLQQLLQRFYNMLHTFNAKHVQAKILKTLVCLLKLHSIIGQWLVCSFVLLVCHVM